MNIIDTIRDPNLFAPWLRDPATWRAWETFLRTLFALPLGETQDELFRRCTGREGQPETPFREGWLVVGRRGGKSFVVALIAVFLACFRDYRDYLTPGERGVIMIIAADRRQARVIFRYITALLEGIPMLDRMVERRTAESVDLDNRVSIEVHTCSFRSVRGYTVVAALLDEIAFWRSEDSANPDAEIVAALRPAMATIPDALLISLSSPYARRGVLYEAHRRHFGQEGSPVLVWQADTQTMNPTVPESVIERAYADDPARAAAEYGAEFRSDIETFLDADLLAGLTRAEPRELPPRPDVPYTGFVDPSGGRHDAFTLAIAHDEGGRVVVDVCRAARAPFDPQSVVAEHAALLKEYGVRTVTGDRYAGAWVEEAFRAHRISYKASELTKSEIYLESLPLFARGALGLPDDRRLLTELTQLERRASRAGRDTVDHPPRGHDDLANAVCGAVVQVAAELRGRQTWSPDDVFLGPLLTMGAGEPFENTVASPWVGDSHLESRAAPWDFD